MTASLPFSIVVTAPRGLAHCDYLAEWQKELAAHGGELIVSDATRDGDLPRSERVRHCRRPGASLQQLMADGAACARGEWVLVTEDHCRPLPGILAAYERAIEEAPHADLIAGAAENLTSVAPWSWAIFAIGLGEFWSRAERPPRSATNANLLIRRSAFRPNEITVGGGLLNGAVPRLIAEGRFAACRDAKVDHVVEVDRRTVVAFEYGVTREAIADGRAFAGEVPSVGADAWLSLKRLVGCALLVPLRTWRNVRGTPLATAPLRLRVAYVCSAVAIRLGRDDLARIARRIAGRFRAGSDLRAASSPAAAAHRTASGSKSKPA